MILCVRLLLVLPWLCAQLPEARLFRSVNVLTYTALGAIVLAVRHQELHLRVREEYR